MSLRRPTVARTAFIFCYKPFMWCRSDVRLWRVFVSYFKYKPFMWCRSDVRLWHALPSFFCYKPFMWCRPDARLWHYYSAVSARGVIQTLVWHQHYYSCSFLSRSHSDTRLAPVLLFCSFLSRSHSDTRLAPVLPFLHFPLEESFRPSFGTQYLLSLCLDALVNLFICFMFSFVISHVRTVLRVLS